MAIHTERYQPLFLVVSILLVVSLVAAGCGESRRTELDGRWQCGVFTISIHRDGLASFGGMKASWKPLDRGAVLLEFDDGEQPMTAELVLERAAEDGTRKATLYSVLTLPCEEVSRNQ